MNKRAVYYKQYKRSIQQTVIKSLAKDVVVGSNPTPRISHVVAGSSTVEHVNDRAL